MKVAQYSLVGQALPWYTFEAVYYPAGLKAQVTLDARRATSIRGTYDAAKPLGAYTAVMGVLKRHDFFEMRLSPATNLYLDGPEDQISVVRCGVTTTLGTVTAGMQEIDLDDARAKAFFALEKDLRGVIFAQQWENTK